MVFILVSIPIKLSYTKLLHRLFYLSGGKVVGNGHLVPLRGRGPLVEPALLLHENRLQLRHLGDGEDVVEVDVEIALLQERVSQVLSCRILRFNDMNSEMDLVCQPQIK